MIHGEVATTPGRVNIRLYKRNGEPTNEVATFHWKVGTTLEFLSNSLTRHSKNLVLSLDTRLAQESTEHQFDANRIRLANPSDITQSVDIKDVLYGQIKAIAVIYDDSLFDNIIYPSEASSNSSQKNINRLTPWNSYIKPKWFSKKHVGDEMDGLSETSTFGNSGRTQLRFMELMSLNKISLADGSEEAFKEKITWEEVYRHCTSQDCWVVLSGKVYDITRYLEFHPGGKKILLSCAGKDITEKFNKYHPWVNAEMILKGNLKGNIDESRRQSTFTLVKSTFNSPSVAPSSSSFSPLNLSLTSEVSNEASDSSFVSITENEESEPESKNSVAANLFCKVFFKSTEPSENYNVSH